MRKFANSLNAIIYIIVTEKVEASMPKRLHWNNQLFVFLSQLFTFTLVLL